jgi:hypothetical protein
MSRRRPDDAIPIREPVEPTINVHHPTKVPIHPVFYFG